MSTGNCSRCSCSVSGSRCTNCYPARKGRCINQPSPALTSESDNILQTNGPDVNCRACRTYGPRANSEIFSDVITQLEQSQLFFPERQMSFADMKMCQAFGATLMHSVGRGVKDVWSKRWSVIASFRCRQYDLPGGSVGREFVSLLSEEVSKLANGEFRSERLVVFMSVLLQRDPLVKKGADVRRLLRRRMDLWRESQVTELLCEAERCSQQLPKPREGKQGDDHTIRVFTRLMLRGQVRSAVRWMTERLSSTSGGVLHPSAPAGTAGKTVLEVLKEKHPEPREAIERAFLSCDELPPLVDVDITAAHVEKVARQIQGSAGPGGTMALQWQRFLLGYGAHSERLRDAVAELTRCLANNIVEWDNISALMACRLLALDKCPGVRPIGIGEVLRRILGKVMALATGMDVEKLCGTDQLCSGLKAGIEGAVHTMRELFEENAGSGWGLLLVDAKNAFNAVNREAALWNARVQWPRASRFLFNTYRGYSILVVQGTSEYIFSKEGVTQGDPLSMLLYAVAVLPLIQALEDREKWIQNWYADDSACAAGLPRLREWFDKLLKWGPDFGYYPEPQKTILVVDPNDELRAKELFDELGVTVVPGQRFLGGFIGNQSGTTEYVEQKVRAWIHCVEKLTKAAESQPQAALAAFTRSLQSEWVYMQRVIPNCADAFTPLRDIIN